MHLGLSYAKPEMNTMVFKYSEQLAVLDLKSVLIIWK